MKRIMLLTTLAAMLAAAMALSGVAQAKPIGGSADAKCAKLARQTLGASYTPANYTFIGGTEGNDTLTGQVTDGPDVICGFGGDDYIFTLGEGDIFLGGAGNDDVFENYGTFYGQEGNDEVVNYSSGPAGGDIISGTFYGGAGNDSVGTNAGTFYGQEGNDQVFNNNGTFYGGVDRDLLGYNSTSAYFYGEEGDDEVVGDNYGEFYGGPGNDYIAGYNGSTFYGGDGIDEVFSGNSPVDGP